MHELQQYFELTNEVPKPVAKRLKAEQEAEKRKQLEEHQQRRRQSTRSRTANQDGNTPRP